MYAKKPARRRRGSDYELLDALEEGVAVVRVDVELEGLGRDDAEDAHQALAVDSVAPGDEVYVVGAVVGGSDEFFYVVYGKQFDLKCLHSVPPIL